MHIMFPNRGALSADVVYDMAWPSFLWLRRAGKAAGLGCLDGALDSLGAAGGAERTDFSFKWADRILNIYISASYTDVTLSTKGKVY